MSPKRVSKEDILIFFTELSRVVQKKLPIQESLKEIAKESKHNISALANFVDLKISEGVPLSKALEEISSMSPYVIALIKSGEQSGALPEILNDVITFYRRSIIARKNLIESLRYPIMVILVFMLVTLFMAIKIIPHFVQIYYQLGAELPGLTVFFIKISNFIVYNLPFIILLTILIIIVYSSFRKTALGRIFESNILLLIPLIGQSIFYDTMGRFCKSLAVMLKRKVPIDMALMLASASTENLIGKKLAGIIAKHLSSGGRLYEGMRKTGLFNHSFVWMVQKAEDSGYVENTLFDIANFYEENFEDVSHKTVTMVEPALICIIGCLLGIIIISFYLPLFSIPKVIGGQ